MDGKRIKVPDEETDQVCELCGKPMVIKIGRFGRFLACSGFPECTNTKKIIKPTGGVCPKCGKKMRRTPEVIDCWFDSGAMPFAQHHYPFENKELFEQQFPADFISESVDQTRGWFYSLLAISMLIFNKAPYKNVVVTGLVQDENGQKISDTGKIIAALSVSTPYARITEAKIQEILFNPRTPGQVTNIRTELKNLLEIIENKDAEGMKKYLTKIREKIK